MIFNRPPNLILGAFTAVFNVFVLVLHSQGIEIGADLVAAVNIAAASVIALVAFTPPTLKPGDTYHVSTPNGAKDIQRTVRDTEPNYQPGSADVANPPTT